MKTVESHLSESRPSPSPTVNCWLLPDGKPVMAWRRSDGHVIHPMIYVDNNTRHLIKRLLVSKAARIFVLKHMPFGEPQFTH